MGESNDRPAHVLVGSPHVHRSRSRGHRARARKRAAQDSRPRPPARNRRRYREDPFGKRARPAQGRRSAVLVRALRSADGWREPLHAAAEAGRVVGREGPLRDHVRGAARAWRRGALPGRDCAQPQGSRKRGLSLRQRIHAGPRQARAARDGLDARRRLHSGLGQLSCSTTARTSRRRRTSSSSP